MGDVGPPAAVALGDLDGVAQQLLLRLASTARRSGRPTARPRRAASCARGARSGSSPPGGRRWRSSPRSTPPAATAATPASAGRSSSRPKTSVSPNTDAVSASVSGVAMWKTPCLEPSAACTPWPELVRERQHVAAQVRVVEHHVRVHARHAVGAERAAALARAAPARRSSSRRRSARTIAPSSSRERRVGVEHESAWPRGHGDLLVVLGDGGHAVVVGEPVDPEQLRLQPIPAARQLVARRARPRSAPARTRRRPRWTGCATASQCGKRAQPVVGHLVREQRVERVGARAQAGLQRRGHALGGVAAHVAVGLEEPRRARPPARPARPRPAARRVIAAVCSSNSRTHAERPDSAFSVRIFSSGSLSRCGR